MPFINVDWVGPTNFPSKGTILLDMIFVMVLYTTLQQEIGLKSPTFGLLWDLGIRVTILALSLFSNLSVAKNSFAALIRSCPTVS